MQPDFPGAYFQLGLNAYTVDGNMVEAAKWFRQELAVDPGRNTTMLGALYLDLGDDVEAERWIERGVRLQPNSFFALDTKLALHRYRGEREEALALARQIRETNQRNNSTLYTLVWAGEFEEAVQTYQPFFPELDCDRDPEVHRGRLFRAMNFSLALEKTGEADCAARILHALLDELPNIPRDGGLGFGFLDVEIYARLGRTELALETLRRAIDEGRRAFFWAQALDSPHTVSLRETAGFQAIAAEVRADMQRQLEELRELERAGRLAVVPDPVVD